MNSVLEVLLREREKAVRTRGRQTLMFSSTLLPITMSSGSKLAMEGPWSAGCAESMAPRSLPVFLVGSSSVRRGAPQSSG